MQNRNTSKKREQQRQDWQKHIKQWQESGLKQAEYCRQNNLSDKLFYWYKRKYADLKPDTKKFIRIPSVNNTGNSPAGKYEIILQGNIHIRVNHDFNSENLKRLIETLRDV